MMRRRRAAAVSALAGVVAAVGVLVVSSGSSDTAPDERAATQPAKPEAKRKPAGGIQVSRAGWMRHPGPVPFLMYHVIGEPKPGAPFPDLYVSVEDFERQIQYLDDHGYQAVTQRQVMDGWEKNSLLPPKPVVLTFDDGYLGQYTDALPLLRRLDWPGVLNLKAEGSDLSTGQVRKMVAAGWEIGSHTVSHADLTLVDATTLAQELSRPLDILRRRFGVRVESFCYPAGRYNEAVVAAVRRAGYRSATTTDPGLASSEEPFTLKRIRIGSDTGLDGLISELRAGAA